jgi:hypothetical protein
MDLSGFVGLSLVNCLFYAISRENPSRVSPSTITTRVARIERGDPAAELQQQVGSLNDPASAIATFTREKTVESS